MIIIKYNSMALRQLEDELTELRRRATKEAKEIDVSIDKYGQHMIKMIKLAGKIKTFSLAHPEKVHIISYDKSELAIVNATVCFDTMGFVWDLEWLDETHARIKHKNYYLWTTYTTNPFHRREDVLALRGIPTDDTVFEIKISNRRPSGFMCTIQTYYGKCLINNWKLADVCSSIVNECGLFKLKIA